MSSSGVEAVVFDIGGVLLDWSPRHFYRELGVDEARIDHLLTSVCTPEWNGELDRGRPFAEACADLAARHPDDADLIHAWRRQDEMVFGEIPGVADIVRDLQRRGVPLFLLTNMPADVFAARRARYDVLSLFSGAVVSGEEGVLKPDPAIFDIVATRFTLDRPRTLFVDDSAANVAAATACGIHGVLFHDASTLRVELTAAGLL